MGIRQLSCIFGGIWRYDVEINSAKCCYFGRTVSLGSRLEVSRFVSDRCVTNLNRFRKKTWRGSKNWSYVSSPRHYTQNIEIKFCESKKSYLTSECRLS